MLVITVARKPLGEGSVAANVLVHGTGGVNVDACRIAFPSEKDAKDHADKWDRTWNTSPMHTWDWHIGNHPGPKRSQGGGPKVTAGRWPSNLILSEAVAPELDTQSGERPGMSGGGATADNANKKTGREVIPSFNRKLSAPFIRSDTGGASRFFKVVGK